MLVKWVAVGFIALGAILVLVSQETFVRVYYELVDSESFSAGQPLMFYWTFEGNETYRFQVETSNWTYPSPWIHWMSVSNDSLFMDSEGGIIQPPYVWHWKAGYNTTTQRVAWWHSGVNYSRIIETPSMSAHVELSQLKKETYQFTELAYAGAAIIAIGAVLVLVEWVRRHRMRSLTVLPRALTWRNRDKSLFGCFKFSNL